MNQMKNLSAATLIAFAAAASAAAEMKPAMDATTTADATAASPVVDTTVDTTGAVDPNYLALDLDGDGSLLQSDLPQDHDLSTDLFAAFDANKDQRLSAAEFAAYTGGSTTTDVMEEDEEAE